MASHAQSACSDSAQTEVFVQTMSNLHTEQNLTVTPAWTSEHANKHQLSDNGSLDKIFSDLLLSKIISNQILDPGCHHFQLGACI